MGGRRLTAWTLVLSFGLLGTGVSGCLVQPADSESDGEQVGVAESAVDDGQPPDDFGDGEALDNPAAGLGGDDQQDPEPEPWHDSHAAGPQTAQASSK